MLKSDKDAGIKKRRSLLWAPLWAVCLVCCAVLFYLIGRQIGRQDSFEAAWNDSSRTPQLALQGLIEGSPQANSHFAEPLIQAEKKFIQQVGKDTPGGAAALSRLAGFYALEGNYTAAEAAYREVLGILTKHLGPNHPDVALIEQNIRTLQLLKTRKGPGSKAAETNAPPSVGSPDSTPAQP